MQFESLNALGIFGRNINSFLSWISITDADDQPSPKSINTKAVQLLTWHASKGLEWPVVIVMGLDKNKKPSLPDISLGYTDTSRTDPLNNSYIRFFTKFQDDNSNEAFIQALNKEAHSTVDNLLYVAMTRAREQLILSWPSFKANVGEFSLMHKLLHKCNMQVTENGINMDNLSRDDGFNEVITLAQLPVESDEQVDVSPIVYGRIAIEAMEKTKQISSQISPSNAPFELSPINKDRPTSKTYGTGVDLSKIDMNAATLGTVIHSCYHVFLVNQAFGDRLFASLDGKLPENIFKQIQQQALDFQTWSKSNLQTINAKCEVPILSTTEQGSVVSGSIDLLLETEDGYWIIDHKSDVVDNFSEKFAHHYSQLDAYVHFSKLEKSLIGVGINWIRYGKITLLPFDRSSSSKKHATRNKSIIKIPLGNKRGAIQ